MDAKGLKRPVSQFSVRDKLEAIGRVHAGESKASVARHIGVPESTLRGWCKSEDKLRTVARSCDDGDKDDATAATKRPRLDEAPDLDESLLLWLKQQQQQPAATLAAGPAVTAAVTTGDKKDGDGWFWRWYKRYGFAQFPAATAAGKSALDGALNNNVEESDEDDEEDEPPATAAEAVAHGEKFLRWLECCSDPSVTAMQILQFRYLLNNVRACAHRRSQARQHGSSRSRK